MCLTADWHIWKKGYISRKTRKTKHREEMQDHKTEGERVNGAEAIFEDQMMDNI